MIALDPDRPLQSLDTLEDFVLLHGGDTLVSHCIGMARKILRRIYLLVDSEYAAMWGIDMAEVNREVAKFDYWVQQAARLFSRWYDDLILGRGLLGGGSR